MSFVTADCAWITAYPDLSELISTSGSPTNRLESFDERREAGSTTTDCSLSGGALRILPEPGHERDASGHQRYASDVTEQFPPHQDLLGHYEERNHDDPEQIHDACHEE